MSRFSKAMDSVEAMPSAENAERAVLAAVLLSPQVLDGLRGELAVSAFHFRRHQILYEVMLELADEGVEIDLRTLEAKLEEQGDFKRVGGMAYLAGLDLDLPDISRVGQYARILRKRGVERAILSVCTSVYHDILEGDLEAEGALVRIGSVASLGEELADGAGRSFAASMEHTLAVMEARADGAGGVPTAFT